MNRTLQIAALSTSILAGSYIQASASDFAPGLQPLTITHSDRPLSGVIWYPASTGADVQRVQNNPVWAGEDAAQDAPIADGTYPLVLLSHGMYGNHRNQNWLASALAEAGYIVVAIDHPGTSTFLRDHDHARELWKRPQDISRTITHMTEIHALAPNIDPDRIYMAGHSLGGWTAMMLAGARFDPVAFDDHCQSGARNIACNVLERWNVAKSPEDRQIIAQDYSDGRIKAYAVLDLGGTQSFDAASLGAIETPMLVIGAPEAGSDIDLDVESRALVAGLTSADVEYLEPEGTSHFDLMGLCTDRGLAILQEEEPQDAIVCQNGTTERRAKHQMFVAAIKALFTQ